MAPSYQHTPTMKTSYFSPTLTAEGLGGIPSSASCGQHLDKLWTCPFLLSSLCDRAGKWNSFYLLSDKGVNKSSQNIILCQLEICKWRVKKTSVEISTKGGVGQTRCTLFLRNIGDTFSYPPLLALWRRVSAPWWSTWRCQIKAKLQRNHNTQYNTWYTAQHTTHDSSAHSHRQIIWPLLFISLHQHQHQHQP